MEVSGINKIKTFRLTHKHLWQVLHRGMSMIGILISLVLVVGLAYVLAYRGRILPGVAVAGIEVGNMTGEEAASLLRKEIGTEMKKIKVVSNQESWEMVPSEIGLEVDLPATINQVWLVGRRGGLLERLGQAQGSFFEGVNLGLVIRTDKDKFEKRLAEIENELNQEAVEPSVTLKQEGEEKMVEVSRGKDGWLVDTDNLRNLLLAKWSVLQSNDQEVPMKLIPVEISEEAVEKIKQVAEKLVDKELVMRLDEESWDFAGEELLGLLRPAETVVFDQKKVEKAVAEFAEGVNRQPRNATFKFEGGKVREFTASREGLRVIEEDLVVKIKSAYFSLLEQERVEILVTAIRTEPKITTSEVNNLGIKELLGKGESTYFHSIPNRVHNVGLAASRIAGVLVAPGEEFSFNDAVGEISGKTGYKTAYVISGGRTVLGDGGGVCQVSTTLFRAALAAGLPILERKAHAYRVGYYEQDYPAGIDATVYSGSADLKFRNDTPAHILIQPVIDTDNYYLAFEIYGTSDGRKAEISTPKLWGQSPPPPTLYQDDPTLPVGTMKQIDWAAWGAKTSFDYKVTRNGETVFEKTFVSTYRPWQAIYLRGTRVD